MNELLGIDISACQKVISWDKVASSGLVSFAFCKSTEGTNFKDSQFDNNWKGIKDVGLIRGCYHFARLSNSALDEANHFLSVVGDKLDLTDMLVLDIETASISGSEFTDWNLTWLERVENQSGCISINYTGGPFYNSHASSPDKITTQKLSRYPLWLAAYSNNPNSFIPSEWSHLGWTFWQKSGDVAPSGSSVLHLPGISGNVDCDIFQGTLEELKTFALNLHTGTTNQTTEDLNTITSDLSSTNNS